MSLVLEAQGSYLPFRVSVYTLFLFCVEKSVLTYRVNSATCVLVFSLLPFQTSPRVQKREGEKMKEAVTIRLITDAGLSAKNSREGGSKGIESDLIYSFREKKLAGRLSWRGCEQDPSIAPLISADDDNSHKLSFSPQRFHSL